MFKELQVPRYSRNSRPWCAQVLGSLPGRVHVPPRLHQKTRPTYLSGASQRSLRHLPPYLSRSRPAITTAVTSMLCRYITFNLIVVRAHCFSLAAGARKNRMWADSACALFSPARRLRFIHSPRTAPTYFLPALSRACVLAVGSSRRGCVRASVARAFDRSLLVSDVSTMFDRYIS